MVTVDKYTAMDAASGVLLAARGHPFGTALGFAILFETGARLFANPSPGRELYNGVSQSAVNIVAAMIGWTATRNFMSRQG